MNYTEIHKCLIALVPRIKNDNYDQKFALQRDMTVADVNDLINADYVRFQRRDARIFFFFLRIETKSRRIRTLVYFSNVFARLFPD